MKTEAVFFDKDGTLLDFDALWVKVSEYAVKEILDAVDMHYIDVNDVLEELGVKDGITDINSVICYGTYMKISEKIYEILMKKGCTVKQDEFIFITKIAYENASDKGEIIPTNKNICGILHKIRDMGIKTALVTADSPLMIEKCIYELGMKGCFDEIYTDNGKYPPKPSPYCIDDFCRKYGIDKSKAVMVGDTATDVDFAHNGGIRMIGIAKGKRNQIALQSKTDIVLSDISHIFEYI